MNEIRKYIDIVEGKLFEKHYEAPLYHVTPMENAINILKSGKFSLSVTPEKNVRNTINPEIQMRKDTVGQSKKREGYRYYLSTSRSIRNSYRENLAEDGYDVTFVLDTTVYKGMKNVYIGPIDYYDYHKSSGGEEHEFDADLISKKSEAEERLWSNSQTIPAIPGIVEAHFYLQYLEDLQNNAFNEQDFVELCKKKNIPLYLYVPTERMNKKSVPGRDKLSSHLQDYLILNKKGARLIHG